MAPVPDMQLIKELVGLGFRGTSLVTAFAIAQAESGADPRQVNPDNPNVVGMWQINLPAHPDVTRACAMDFDCSTKAMKRISKNGTDWSPWQTYTNGMYGQFVQQGFDAVLSYGKIFQPGNTDLLGGLNSASDIAIAGAGQVGNKIDQGANAASDAFNALTGIPNALLGAFSAATTRILWGAFGLVAVVIGLFLMFNPGQNVADAITKAAETKGATE